MHIIHQRMDSLKVLITHSGYTSHWGSTRPAEVLRCLAFKQSVDDEAKEMAAAMALRFTGRPRSMQEGGGLHGRICDFV
jgi:hypothetical protein